MDEAGDRLDSWKEIAVYLKRDVTTVQRWEKREGMPVHRHLHDKLGSVYAFRAELDTWGRSRNIGLPREEKESPVAAPSRRRPYLLSWISALVVVTAASAGAYAWLRARTEVFWRNPLAHAQVSRVPGLDGSEQAAAISRDGRFIAFQSDRDGHIDVWMTQVGTGRVFNLTQGRFPDLANDLLRTIAFTPDAALVTFWVRHPDKSVGVWAVPTLRGDPQPYLEGIAEFDWSSDGSLLVYHTTAAGDPTFIRDPKQGAKDRELFRATAGLHAHFQVWSPDRAFIYFVEGEIVGPDLRNADIFRIKAGGGAPERITHHSSRVTHPLLLDDRTLIYLATDADGSGPWLYTIDTERRVPHRLSPSIDAYNSIAASADGRHIVLTVARPPKGTLWRISAADQPVDTSQGSPISLTTGRGLSPRLGPDYLVYVSSTGLGDGIWKIGAGGGETAISLWAAEAGRIFGGPAIDADGTRIAFCVEHQGKTSLYVMNADGTQPRVVTTALTLLGSPGWTPDGAALTSAATVNGTPRLFRIALDGSVTPLAQDYAVDPVWSRDGRFVIYSGPDVGTSFSLSAVTPAGAPYPLPKLTLTRGARRVRFVNQGRTLVVMRGTIRHKDLWTIDLDTGAERQLTRLPPDFNIEDFDVSGDGREIVLERVQPQSEVVLLNTGGR